MVLTGHGYFYGSVRVKPMSGLSKREIDGLSHILTLDNMINHIRLLRPFICGLLL